MGNGVGLRQAGIGAACKFLRPLVLHVLIDGRVQCPDGQRKAVLVIVGDVAHLPRQKSRVDIQDLFKGAIAGGIGRRLQTAETVGTPLGLDGGVNQPAVGNGKPQGHGITATAGDAGLTVGGAPVPERASRKDGGTKTDREEQHHRYCHCCKESAHYTYQRKSPSGQVGVQGGGP